MADGEKAKSEQRLGDAPRGSCGVNKGQVTYDVSIRTLASGLFQVLGLRKTPVYPQHTLRWDRSPPQLLSSGPKDFRSDFASVLFLSLQPLPNQHLPNFPLSPTLSSTSSLYLARPLHPVRLCNSPSIPQSRLSSPEAHLRLQNTTPHSSAVPRSESQPFHKNKSKNSPFRLYLSLPCSAGSV